MGAKAKWVSAAVLGVLAMAMAGCENQELTQLREQYKLLQAEYETMSDENRLAMQERDQALQRVAMHRDQMDDLEASIEKKNSQVDDLKARFAGTGATVELREGLPTLVLPQKLTFASGQAELTSGGKTLLKRIAQVLKTDFADQAVRVEGHTDDDPPKKVKARYPTNWELSAARALNTVRYLQDECGVDGARLAAAGYSQYHPMSKKKADNRRVEIVILPAMGR